MTGTAKRIVIEEITIVICQLHLLLSRLFIMSVYSGQNESN